LPFLAAGIINGSRLPDAVEERSKAYMAKPPTFKKDDISKPGKD